MYAHQAFSLWQQDISRNHFDPENSCASLIDFKAVSGDLGVELSESVAHILAYLIMDVKGKGSQLLSNDD